MNANEDTIARRLPDIRLATLQKPPELEKIDVADYLQCGWKEQLDLLDRECQRPEQVSAICRE